MRYILLLLLLAGSCFGQTVATDILPNTTGYNLGSPTQQWNAFIQNLTVYGNLGISGNILGPIIFTNPALNTGNGVLMQNSAQYVATTNTTNLNLFNFSLLNHGASGVMSGLVLTVDTDTVDTGTGISVNNNGKSDNYYAAVAGKAGAVASAPSGYACDLNRSGSVENATLNTGYCANLWDWSSTDQGSTGPNLIYLKKQNNPNSQHRALHISGNRNLLTLDLPEGGGFSSAFTVAELTNGSLQKWNMTANGDQNFANGRQLGFAMNSGAAGAIRSQPGANTLDFQGGLQGFRWISNDGTVATMFLSNAGQLNLPIVTGTSPFSVASTTPVANLTAVPTTYTHGGTQVTGVHIVRDLCTIGTSCSITLAGAAVFSDTAYQCACADQTAAAACKIVNTSATQIDITGTGTDVISYLCVGN